MHSDKEHISRLPDTLISQPPPETRSVVAVIGLLRKLGRERLAREAREQTKSGPSNVMQPELPVVQ